jgi:hypothetical protein
MQVRRWRARTLVAGLVLAAALAGGMVAAAAGADDRASAEAALREVESAPKKEVAAEMIARARAALERGTRLRAAGDEAHARLADGLARTWAEAARDVLRAVDVEERAQAARRAATDAGVLAERERALLEEGIAQSGRLRAQLDTVEKDAKEQPARTSAAANAPDADGGAARPRAPRRPSGDERAPKVPATAQDGGAR